MNRLVLFAKEPVAGRVKTRLAKEIGDDAALRLYTAFLSDLAAAMPADEWEAVLAAAEEPIGPHLAATFAGGWGFTLQGEGSLGDRLSRTFRAAFEDGVEACAVAGSDAPMLNRGVAREAFAALVNDADVVFAPAPDGGYSLVGLSSAVDPERVFRDVRWSTSHALADTRGAAEREGYRVALLPELLDVDESRDLAALRTALDGDPRLCPATRGALAEEGP